MTAALPVRFVVVVEGVVAKDLNVGVGSDEGGIVAEALTGEARVGLHAKGDADDGVGIQSEYSGGIGGDAVIPADTGEAETGLVDDGGREGVDPASAAQLGGIDVLGREGDGSAPSGCHQRWIESRGGELVGLGGIPIDPLARRTSASTVAEAALIALDLAIAAAGGRGVSHKVLRQTTCIPQFGLLLQEL